MDTPMIFVPMERIHIEANVVNHSDSFIPIPCLLALRPQDGLIKTIRIVSSELHWLGGTNRMLDSFPCNFIHQSKAGKSFFILNFGAKFLIFDPVLVMIREICTGQNDLSVTDGQRVICFRPAENTNSRPIADLPVVWMRYLVRNIRGIGLKFMAIALVRNMVDCWRWRISTSVGFRVVENWRWRLMVRTAMVSNVVNVWRRRIRPAILFRVLDKVRLWRRRWISEMRWVWFRTAYMRGVVDIADFRWRWWWEIVFPAVVMMGLVAMPERKIHFLTGKCLC